MKSRRNLPTQERLRELLDYSPESGVFTWRALSSPKSRVKVGDVAGCINPDGYRLIRIDGADYLAHRLAFVWMTGNCPVEIDHRDRNRINNAWTNLRPATGSQNQANQGMRVDNTSGVKGVSWSERDGKWAPRIMINGRRKYLGLFADLDDAAAAYRAAAVAHWGEFASS